MPEINIDIEYFDHRKTKRLILRFGEDAAIYPIKIWSYAARHHPVDGLFSGYDDEEIAAILSASSNATSILQALLDVGFLERTPQGIAVHGWVERQGHIVAYHERAKHAANERWSKLRGKRKNIASSNATSIPKHTTSNALQEGSLVSQVQQDKQASSEQETRAEAKHDFKNHPWFSDAEFLKEWSAWGKERRKAGTERNFSALRGLAGDDLALAVQIVAKSADNGWKGFWPLENGNSGNNSKTGSRAVREGREYHEDLKL